MKSGSDINPTIAQKNDSSFLFKQNRLLQMISPLFRIGQRTQNTWPGEREEKLICTCNCSNSFFFLRIILKDSSPGAKEESLSPFFTFFWERVACSSSKISSSSHCTFAAIMAAAPATSFQDIFIFSMAGEKITKRDAAACSGQEKEVFLFA